MKIEHIAMYVNDLERAKISSQSILMQQQMLDILIKQPAFVLIF